MTPETAMDVLLSHLREGVAPPPDALRALQHSTDGELIEGWWNAGSTDKEMAKLFGQLGRVGRYGAPLSATALRKRRYALDLKLDPLPVVDRAQLRALWAQGANARDISDLLGCSWRTAQELLFREGLKTRSGRRSILRKT